MAGMITHISISVIGFLLIWFIFKNYKYGLGFAAGQSIPDWINWGFLTLYLGHFSFYGHMAHPWFGFLTWLGHTWWLWFVFTGSVFLVIAIGYFFKLLTPIQFKQISLIILFFLIGTQVHMLADMYINEPFWWL